MDNEVPAREVRMVPLSLRMRRKKAKETHGGKGQDTRLVNLMRDAKNRRSFVIAGPDTGVPTETVASWLCDTGTEVTQISVATAERMWEAVTPIQSVDMQCKTAFSTSTKELKLCEITGLQLWDAGSGPVTAPINTFAFINAALDAHEGIMGTNTIVDFGVSIDLMAGALRSPEHAPVIMLTEAQTRQWIAQGRGPLHVAPERAAPPRKQRMGGTLAQRIARKAKTQRQHKKQTDEHGKVQRSAKEEELTVLKY